MTTTDGTPPRGLPPHHSDAAWSVRTDDSIAGFGVWGSYPCETDAWRVCRDLRRRGHVSARVEPANDSFLEAFLAMEDRLIV